MIRAPLGVPSVSVFDLQRGFCARAAEGFWVDGRIIFVGARHVITAPMPGGRLSGDCPGWGVLHEVPQDKSQMSLPVSLGQGVLFFGSEVGLFACSMRTGETQCVRMGVKNRTVPILQVEGTHIDIWTVVGDDIASTDSCVRLTYQPNSCLNIGQFSETVNPSPAPRDLLAGFFWSATGEAPGASREPWFYGQNRLGPAFSWQPQNRPDNVTDEKMLRVTSADGFRSRVSLNQSLKNHESETFWLSRTGSNEDGAVVGAKNWSEPLYEVGRGWTESIFEEKSLEILQPPIVAARLQPVDRWWARLGPQGGARWAWGGDEERVRLVCEPENKKWDVSAMTDTIHRRIDQNRIAAVESGPVVPTPWGIATCVVTVNNPAEVLLIYLDFPS